MDDREVPIQVHSVPRLYMGDGFLRMVPAVLQGCPSDGRGMMMMIYFNDVVKQGKRWMTQARNNPVQENEDERK
jgi:hypothetical protein